MVSNESATKYSHLCQILAHYLVYLGSCLKLSLASDLEQLLLETVPSRWNKRGKFEWGIGEGHGEILPSHTCDHFETFDTAAHSLGESEILVVFDTCFASRTSSSLVSMSEYTPNLVNSPSIGSG